MTRVGMLISGGGSNMLALVNAMQSDGFALPALVFSNVPDCAGLKRARRLGVPTATVDHKPFKGDRHAFEAEMNKALNTAKVDLICLAGFMRITTPEFIAGWTDRILNIHPSLLPKYPGLNTHSRALDAGDRESGCTVHVATEILDDGPILGQARVPISPDDTPETLAARVLKQEHILYPAVLKRFVAGERAPLFIA